MGHGYYDRDPLPDEPAKSAGLDYAENEEEAAFLIWLLAKAKEIPPPTERERQAQALSFAYGNLAMSTNHQPTYAGFQKLAQERYGWTADEFAIFAATRKWA